MARNHTLRIMDNNLAIRTSDYYTKSSENSSYPFSNVQSTNRSKYWRPNGAFTIDGTNNTIHFNDGSARVGQLTNDTYTSGSALATAIQTAMNTVSSGYTVTYSTSTYKFTISRATSFTLNTGNFTGGGIWLVIGFTAGTDISGTSHTSDQQRVHSEEYVIYDLSSARAITFVALIGPAGERFSISPGATVKIQGNDLDSWSDPALDVEMEWSEDGYFAFLDGQSDYTFRYWKISIIDYLNPDPSYKISYIYLGDHITFEDRCVAYGYEKVINDNSIITETESGRLFFDERTKVNQLSSLKIDWIKRADKDALIDMYKVFGKTNPFFISVDPTMLYTDNLNELTKFVYFLEEPRFTHVMRDFFTTTLTFREVV